MIADIQCHNQRNTVAAPGGGNGGANAPPVRGFAPHLPPQSEWIFFFFFLLFFFFTFFFFFFFFFFYLCRKSHQVTNLKLISAFSAISVSINKVIHRRSIVYNIQWCGIIYVCTYTRVTHTEKRKSKIFRGLRPLDPRQGLCPCTPPGGPKVGPWTPPKIGSRLRARYVRSAHMFAPPKKIGSRLRARYICALRAHVCPKKNRTPAIQKKSARASRSLCALRAHVCPPHNQSLPPSCPPTF